MKFARNRREQDTQYQASLALCCPQNLYSPRRPCFHSQGRSLSPSFLEPIPANLVPQTSPGTTHPSLYLHALMYHVPCNSSSWTAQTSTPPDQGAPQQGRLSQSPSLICLVFVSPQNLSYHSQLLAMPESHRGMSPVRVGKGRGQGG